MKPIFLCVVLLISVRSLAQQASYEDWKKKAKTEINLQPEYGNVIKNAGEVEADKKFIETVLKQDTTRRKGSEQLVELGFNYLYRGDIETAMRRFNQAWLVDPKNENAYWGYAVVYFNFNDIQQALKQLEKGLVINPQNPYILTDKATIYMSFYMNGHREADLNSAIDIFKQSYNIDPSNQNTLFKLSAAYYYKKDCQNAWRYYNECMKLGGRPIPNGYVDNLKEQCKM